MAEKTLKIKGLGIHEIDDLNFVLKDKIMPNYGENEDDVVNEITEDVSHYLIPISIDHLIDIVNKFKEIGASHIGMFQHIDHQGYVFEGYDIQEVDNKVYLDKNQKEIDNTLDEINSHIRKLVEMKDKLSSDSLSVNDKKILIENFK